MNSNVSKKTRWVLATIILLAFVLRLGAIIALRSWEHPVAMEHDAIARGLLKYGSFNFAYFGYYGPTSVQSPPYPLLLAGLRIVSGSWGMAYFLIMVINALAAAATVGVVYAMARTLGAASSVGLVAAALVAVWPTQIYASAFAQAIALITLCMALVVVLFYRAVRTGGLGAWIGFSVVGCLGALTEPVMLPLMAFSGLLIFFYRRLHLSIRIRNAAILLGAAMVIIGPWTLRNRLVHGRWIPIKSTFWVNVWKGNNPYATGTDRLAMTPAQRQRYWAGMFRLTDIQARETDTKHQETKLTPEQLSQLYGQPEPVRETLFKKWAMDWITTHPWEYLKLSLIRLKTTLWIDWNNPKSYKLVYVASRALLLALAAGGLVLAIRRKWTLMYPALLIGSCLLTYMLTITAARFLLPLEPFFLCLGGLFLVEIWQRTAGRRLHRDEPSDQVVTPAGRPLPPTLEDSQPRSTG